MSQTFAFDVFLSYSSEDRQQVLRLAEQLRDVGLKVWFDEWVIKPGDDIYLAVEHGLAASRTLILCMSPATFGSDWVSLERTTVRFRDPTNQNRHFIPLLLADCELPEMLRRYKYVDYREATSIAFYELVNRFTDEPTRSAEALAQEQRLIAELSGRAAKGEQEKGYLLNEEDGAVLDEKEADDATPYEVDFPEHAVRQAEGEGRRVTYVHSHQIVSPPSEKDWGLIVDFPALLRFVAVCADRVFVLERTPETKNPFRSSAQTIFLLEQNVLVKKSSIGNLPFKKALAEMPADEMFELLRAVNKKMAQTYGVRFKEQEL